MSSIDPTKPTDEAIYAGDLRANWGFAKVEIEGVQEHVPTFVNDAGNYSVAEFQVGTGGASSNEIRRFTGNFANLIKFSGGLPADAYGVLINGSGAAMRLQSPSGVTINGVNNADIALFGHVSWWRQGEDQIFVEGGTDETKTITGTLHVSTIIGPALVSTEPNNILTQNLRFWVGTMANLPTSPRNANTFYFTVD